MLKVGVRVYQYTRGMMHAKVLVIDDSFRLGRRRQFRQSQLVSELRNELHDLFACKPLRNWRRRSRGLEYSIRLDPKVYGRRPITNRLLENASRLMSPVL